MTVIIGMLVIMAALFFVMGWLNKYSWLASLIMAALALSMYSVMMMIAIKANYMPAGFIGKLDELYFLNIVKNRMGIFTLNRVFNISVGVYIFAMMNFVPVYFNHFGKYDLKRFIRRLPGMIFPLVYIWFYDRQTSYWFYNCIAFGKLSFDTIKWADLVITIILVCYMIWPLIYILSNLKGVKLRHKRRQVLGLFAFVLSLNLIMLIIYSIYGLKSVYLFESPGYLINVSGIMSIGSMQYTTTLLSIAVLIVVCVAVAFKFDIMPRRGFFVRYIFARDMQKINNNFFSMFHSVKKTIFMYKILAERALYEEDQASKETLKELIGEMDSYLARVNHMQQMNSEPEIFMERMDISDIIEDAVSRYNHEKSVCIDYKAEYPGIMVEADSFYLADVFDNILKNAVEAIKRKKDSGNIAVTAECEHEWVIIKFCDDGEGIAKKNIKNIFKPLYTTKARTTNWGLGLSFAVKIIKIHMGHIFAESTPGEGTTVTILLPRVERN